MVRCLHVRVNRWAATAGGLAHNRAQLQRIALTPSPHPDPALSDIPSKGSGGGGGGGGGGDRACYNCGETGASALAHDRARVRARCTLTFALCSRLIFQPATPRHIGHISRDCPSAKKGGGGAGMRSPLILTLRQSCGTALNAVVLCF